MDLGLAGKAALVCGASRGLGFAIARALVDEGADVAISGRREEAVCAAVKHLSTGRGRVVGTICDLGTSAGREAAVDAGIAGFGKLDIAVLNIGGPPTGGLETLDLQQWEAAYRQLVESAVHLSKLVVPLMAARRWGRLLAITSFATRQPADQLLLSNSLRASVSGLVRSIANEYGDRAVTANCILPGYIRTQRMEQVAADQAAAHGLEVSDSIRELARSIPLKRIGEPEELASVAAFLLSERASYLTGASITVDGGLVRTIY